MKISFNSEKINMVTVEEIMEKNGITNENGYSSNQLDSIKEAIKEFKLLNHVKTASKFKNEVLEEIDNIKQTMIDNGHNSDTVLRISYVKNIINNIKVH